MGCHGKGKSYSSFKLMVGIGSIKFLEGIAKDYKEFQMDVYFCHYRDYNDDCARLCRSCYLANQRILSLFTAWVNVGESFYTATRSESAVNVVFVLNTYHGVVIDF
jgi:hypothetical protein